MNTSIEPNIRLDILIFNGAVEGSSFDEFVYDVETLSKKYSPYGGFVINFSTIGSAPKFSEETEAGINKRIYCDKSMNNFYISIIYAENGKIIEKSCDFSVINKKKWDSKDYNLFYDRKKKAYAIFIAE